MYSAARLVTEELGYEIKPSTNERTHKTQNWKTRLENKINQLHLDISNLELLKKELLRNTSTRKLLIKKYCIISKTGTEVLETKGYCDC